MSIREIDAKGRITLPKKDRERIGTTRVLILNAGDHLKVIPIPHKSLADLKCSLAILKTFKELRREAEKLALHEANRVAMNTPQTT